MRIEVIDDDDAVRDSTCTLLDSYGYEVRGYSSADEFLKLRQSASDCLIVDQHMPGITGLELITHLRATGDKTPAVMITGRSDLTIEPRANSLGVKVLHKPLAEQSLVASIEALRRVL